MFTFINYPYRIPTGWDLYICSYFKNSPCFVWELYIQLETKRQSSPHMVYDSIYNRMLSCLWCSLLFISLWKSCFDVVVPQQKILLSHYHMGPSRFAGGGGGGNVTGHCPHPLKPQCHTGTSPAKL